MDIATIQCTVTTAGTVKRFTSGKAGTWRIKALPKNAGLVYFGYAGSTSLTTQTGYALAPTTSVVSEWVDVTVPNLNVLYLDAANDGDGVCCIRISGDIIAVRPPI